MSTAEKLDIRDRAERGLPQKTKELQDAVDTANKLREPKWALIRKLKPSIESVIEHYWARQWQDPKAAAEAYTALMHSQPRNPMRGRASFLRQRAPFTSKEMMDYNPNLKLLTDNPFESELIKNQELDKFIAVEQMRQQLEAETYDGGRLLRWFKPGQRPPGWTKLGQEGDPTFTKYKKPVKGDYGRTTVSEAYMPDNAARIFNNYLKGGLRGSATYRGARWLSNIMVGARLGLSAFHFTFTAADAMFGQMALGLRRFENGDLAGGLKDIGTALYAPRKNYLAGKELMRLYKTHLDNLPPEDRARIENIIRGGGRVSTDPFYHNSAMGNFWKALREGKPGQTAQMRGLDIVKNAPGALIQAAAYPIMEKWVPRLKLGAFDQLAKFEIERLGSGASREQVTTALQKAWESVDNRLGQIVYDNLHWSRTLKDLGLITTQALGWNIGTWRELGGGLKDLATMRSRLRAGDTALTNRLAYTVALAGGTAIMGGMLNYLLTGKSPESIKDYLFPKTGNKNPDGSDERISFPSYMKDVYSMSTHPLATIGHKLNPVVSSTIDLMQNKNFYGTQIRDPHDSWIRQAGDVLRYAGETIVPFSIKGFQQRERAGESFGKSALSFVGIQPAPSSISRSPALDLAYELRGDQGIRTKAVAEKAQKNRDLVQMIREKKDAEIAAKVKSGEINPADVREMRKRAKTPAIVAAIERLTADQSLRVWDKMDDEEKKATRMKLVTKVLNARQTHNRVDYEDLRKRAIESGIIKPPPK